MTNRQGEGPLDNADKIIERFGGIRPMANKMEVPVTTVQGWKKRNVIPGNRREDVLRTARTNDIDLADIVESAANQNGNENTVDTVLKNTAGHRNIIDEKRSEKEVLLSTGKSDVNQDDLMKKIRAAEKNAVRKSTGISTLLIVAAIACAAFLLWPTQKHVADNENRLTTLEDDVGAVGKEQFFLKSLIPTDLESRFDRLKNQAENIQAQVSDMSRRAEEIKKGVISPGAGPLSQRIAVLEQEVAGITGGPSKLTDMLSRVRRLERSLEGQQQFSTIMADLNMLVESTDGTTDLAGALAGAQQEEDALGQTLQGVAPADLKAAALLLSLAQFRSSLNRDDKPFNEDLALIQKMIGDKDPALNAAIERLAPRSANGVLTPEGLSNQFKGLAGDIVVSSLKGEDVSIREKAMARLNDVLQVQKNGALITGTDTQATVARARKLLDEGNIESAVRELQSLDGDAAQTASPWLAEAQQTMLAQQLQEMLANKAISMLGSGTGFNVNSTGGAEIGDLIESIKNMGAGQHVLRNEESGITILPQGPKFGR